MCFKEKKCGFSHLIDTDEFSLQIFGSVQTLRWKSNCSLSKAVPVCVLNKQESKKHWLQSHLTDTDEFSLQIFGWVPSHVKIWLFSVKSCPCMYLSWKKKFLKLGSRVTWQTDEFSLQIYVSVQSHVKMWLFAVKSVCIMTKVIIHKLRGVKVR